MTLPWNAESLWEDLEPLLPGLSIEVVAEAVSTNTSLLDRARAEAEPAGEGLALVRRSRESAAFGRREIRAIDPLPCLLVAEHQTGGRGRMGRAWASVPGASLTFSLSLPIDRADWSGLSLAVGVALADALDPPAGGATRIGLKWPNDLWLGGPQGGRKLGGILIESVLSGPGRRAIVGVGLNIAPRPPGTPAEFTHGYACLQELDPAYTAPAALQRVARPLVEALRAFGQGGFAHCGERFAARDLLRGQAVTTTQAGLPSGIAEGVGPDGALRVRDDHGVLHDVTSGEVSVRLQAPAPPGGTPC